MNWWKAPPAAAIALALLFTSCSGSSEEATTTTGDAATTVTATGDAASSTAAGGATSTTVTGATGNVRGTSTTSTTEADLLPDYSIESRTAGQGGDTVVVLLPVGTYSDLDLENVVVDVVERFAPIVTVHVVDDAGIIGLVLQPLNELSAEERQLLDEHYFVRLEEGFRLIYQGPFAAAGQVILGS